MAVLDLCLRTFARVEAFHMVLVPGLECVEDALSDAERLYGVRIHRVIHWIVGRMLHGGVYCAPQPDVPVLKLGEVHEAVRIDTGIRLIAHGAKRADSLWRRQYYFAPGREHPDMLYPVIGWTKHDVIGYLRARGLTAPLSNTGVAASGLDLTDKSLDWLHREHPRDFDRLCEVFPFAAAVPARIRTYGMSAPTKSELRERGVDVGDRGDP